MFWGDLGRYSLKGNWMGWRCSGTLESLLSYIWPMMDVEAGIKAGFTCAGVTQEHLLERRVRSSCILTSGRRAPSSHPARWSCCHRRMAPSSPLKNSLLSLFSLSSYKTRERRVLPSRSVRKAFYLEPPPPPISPPPRRTRNRSHVLCDYDQIDVLSMFGETCLGIRRWSPLQRHRPWLLAGQSTVCVDGSLGV